MKYGISAAQLRKLFTIQNGKCKGCDEKLSNPFDKTDWSLGWKLQVDHDHSAADQRKAVRGLLCPSCNRLLGKVQDDWARLQRLHDYLLAPRPEL